MSGSSGGSTQTGDDFGRGEEPRATVPTTGGGMTNQDHFALVESGRAAVAAFQMSSEVPLDLRNADLSERDLSGFDLSGARFDRADLTGATLSHADMAGASLRRSDLTMANLVGADLSGAILYRASFTAAGLSGTVFSGACFGFTCVSDCDFSSAIGLDDTIHELPSSIGADTLLKSLRGGGTSFSPVLRKFFCDAGIGNEILEAIEKTEQSVTYHGCFIAYGAPDEEFAKRLHRGLTSKGVPCWFFPVNAKVGQPTRAEERRGLQAFAKVLVVCSADGLSRPGVVREIDETIQEDPLRLLPVLRDNGWLAESFNVMRDGRDLKPFLVERVWADFSTEEFDDSYERLLAGLRKTHSTL